MKAHGTIKVIKETQRTSPKTGKPYTSLAVMLDDNNWYSDFANQHNSNWQKGMEVQFEYETKGNFKNIVWPKRENNYGRQQPDHDAGTYGAPQQVDTRQTGYVQRSELPTRRPDEGQANPPSQTASQPTLGLQRVLDKIELMETRLNTKIDAMISTLMGFLQRPAVKNLTAEDEFNRKVSELKSFEDESDVPF
jgi:hypothetical protein